MSTEDAHGLRRIVFAIMTDPDFAAEARRVGIIAAAKSKGFDVSDEDAKKLEQIDLDDVSALLSNIERDLSLMMGGSRPRRAIALTDGAIQELQEALKGATRIEDPK